MPKNTTVLQTTQNNMIRVILGLKKEKHINMMLIREKIQMFSINQICVYHTLLEAYNIMRMSASEQIRLKWTDTNDKKYILRSITNDDLKIPEKPVAKCLNFTYNGAKLFNMPPKKIRETQNQKTFKILTKEWIWKNIPSY